MTPPTDIGKEPPRDQTLVDCWSDHEVIEYVQMVRADYADYWRRRALAAEALLREALKAIGAENRSATNGTDCAPASPPTSIR